MMMPKQPITVQTPVHAPLQKVWELWTDPQAVMAWNYASDDWHTPSATNDLRVGGEFHYRMAARDGSFSFDFTGVYTEVIPETKIAYALGDARNVSVEFQKHGDAVLVTETFDPEETNPIEMQREGWQAILDHFKKHAENR